MHFTYGKNGVLLNFKVEKILKGSLDSISSPSVKIQITGGKVCLRCKGKTLLGVVTIFALLPQVYFPANNLNIHWRWLDLLKSFLLYLHTSNVSCPSYIKYYYLWLFTQNLANFLPICNTVATNDDFSPRFRFIGHPVVSFFPVDQLQLNTL